MLEFILNLFRKKEKSCSSDEKLEAFEMPMQEVTLIREKAAGKEYTLGTMYLNNEEICKTLEDPWLNNKQGVSCIPLGIYKCNKDTTGRFRYWKVLDVKGRGDVEIHNGNTHDDTKGCILVGNEWGNIGDTRAVRNSKVTLKKLKKLLDDEFMLNIVEI